MIETTHGKQIVQARVPRVPKRNDGVFPKWSGAGAGRLFCVASPASALDTGE